MTKTVKGILIAIVAFVLLAGIVVGVLVGFGLYGWRRAVRAGTEEAAVRHLQTITIIEKQYYNTHNRNFGTFDQLVTESMLDERFRGEVPVVDGYVYTLRVTPANAGKAASFTLNADPENPNTGDKHFYADDTSGTIHINPNRRAHANDP